MSASFSSLLQYAFGSQYQVVCALGHDHSDRDQTAENGKRIEKGPEGTGIETSQMIVEAERYAFEQITECNTADNRRNKAADEEEPVPGVSPSLIGNLASVVEADRTEEECKQYQQHGPVETGEGCCVDQRPSGKDGTAAGDEPNLVAVPMRSDRIDHDTAFVVVLTDERQKRSDAHILTVHDGETG